MSNVEDYGVKVNFDNSDFNDNIDSSEKKLNSFQDTLSSFTSSLRNIRFNGNINLGELLNFAAIQTGIYRIKNEIQSIGDPIESVADKALRVVNNVVNSAVQQIKSGGMQRALNIEAAKFQIEGLKLDVDTFMEAADYAVSGTAYSLDAAAKAASQLGASGITQLEDLKKALRGISGVAAMANSDYESIAHIFTTVAGQGKLMTMQLQSLSTRGLNIAAELGKVLGKSEKEIRDMVTKGQIDFKTFAMAMDDAFGEHAKDANKTFTGAMSNIKAALSRIGEGFATPYIQDMVGVFNQIRLTVNDLKAELTDTNVYKNFSDALKEITDKVVNFFEELRYGIAQTPLIENLSILFYDMLDTVKQISGVFLKVNWGEFKQIGDSLSTVVEVVDWLFFALKRAFDEVFGIREVFSKFSSVTEWAFSLLDVFEALYDGDIEDVFKNWFSALKEVLITIKDVLGISFDSRKAIKDMLSDGIKAALEFFKTLKLSEETVENLKSIFGGIAAAINLIKDLIFSVFSFLSPVFSAAFGAVKGLGKEILKVLGYLGNFFMELNNAQKEQKMFESFFNTLSKYFGYLFDFLKKIGGAFHDIFLGGSAESDGSGLSFIEKIFAFLDRVGELANEAMDKFHFNGIDFKPIQEFLKNISNFGFSDSELNTAATGLEKSGSFIIKIIDWIKQMFGDIFSSKNKDSVVQSGSVEKTTKVTEFIENMLTWIQDLVTTIVQNTDPGLLAAGVLGGLSAIIASSALVIDALLNGIAAILTVILGFIIEKDVKKFAEGYDVVGQIAKFTDAFTNLADKIPDMVKSVKEAVEGFKPLSGIFGDGKDSFGEQVKKVIMSLVWLVVAIAGALFFVALIPANDLFKAVGALSLMAVVISGVLVAIAVISKIISKFSITGNPLMAAAGAIALISFSVIEIASALYIAAKGLEGYNIGQIATVVGSIVILLAVISGILIGFSKFQEKVAVLPSDFLFLSGAFAILGFAIIEIAASIALIASILQNEKDIGKAWAVVGMISVVLAVIGTIFGLISFFVKDSAAAGLNMILAGAGMMLMFSGVSSIILAIANMLLILSMIDIDKLDKAMDAMETIIIALGVVMVVLSVIGLVAGLAGEMGSIGLLALAAAILTFAILIASLTLPLAAAAIAIAAFASVLKSIKDLFGYLKDLAPEDAEKIGNNLKEIIGSIAESIPESAGRRVLKGLEMLEALFPEFLNFFNSSFLPFVAQVILATSEPVSEAMIEAFINIMSTVQAYLPQIFEILYNLFFGPSQVYDTIIKWLDELWDRTVIWLSERIPIWVEDIADLLLILIKSINLAMEGKWEEFDEEISRLIDNTINLIKDIVTDAETVTEFNTLFTTIAQIISDAVHGDEVMNLVHDAFKDLAGEAVAAFIEGLTESDDSGLLGNFNLFGKFGNISDWNFGNGSILDGVIGGNLIPSSRAERENNNLTRSHASKSGATQKPPVVNVYNNNSSDSFGIVQSVTKIVTEKARSGASNAFGLGQ